MDCDKNSSQAPSSESPANVTHEAAARASNSSIDFAGILGSSIYFLKQLADIREQVAKDTQKDIERAEKAAADARKEADKMVKAYNNNAVLIAGIGDDEYKRKILDSFSHFKQLVDDTEQKAVNREKDVERARKYSVDAKNSIDMAIKAYTDCIVLSRGGMEASLR